MAGDVSEYKREYLHLIWGDYCHRPGMIFSEICSTYSFKQTARDDYCKKTIKGKGFLFLENKPGFHGRLSPRESGEAIKETGCLK